jgi:hypothetical protein
MFGTGFITVLIYGSGGGAIQEVFALLTENNLNILTESSQDIEIEH